MYIPIPIKLTKLVVFLIYYTNQSYMLTKYVESFLLIKLNNKQQHL